VVGNTLWHTFITNPPPTGHLLDLPGHGVIQHRVLVQLDAVRLGVVNRGSAVSNRSRGSDQQRGCLTENKKEGIQVDR
jgi:hypothetical protein